MSTVTDNTIGLISMREAAIWLGITERCLFLWRDEPRFIMHRSLTPDGRTLRIFVTKPELLRWIYENKKHAWRRLLEKGIVSEKVAVSPFYADAEGNCHEL